MTDTELDLLEETPKRKKPKNKRDWVKNAIIIFLAVLLVLTFFSNTIMNYSLPEVAAQYPQSTAITTKIRGSGTVEAAQSYNVTVQETRTVASVNVKKGDQIAAGDTLMTLDETESQELQEARIAYNNLKLEVDKMKVDKADQTATASASISQAQSAVSRAQTDLANARTYESNLKWYQNQESSAKSDYNTKTQYKEYYASQVESLNNQLASVETSNEAYLIAQNRVQNNPEDQEAAAELERIYNEEIAPKKAELSQQLLSAQQNLLDAATAESQASAAYTAAQDATAKYQSDNPDVMSVSSAQSALQNAQDALSTAQAAAKDTAEQKEYDDSISQVELAAKEQELQEAAEKVELLEQKTGAAKIVSRYAGVVTEVNIAAGDTTTANETLLVVELTEKGYTLKSTVTKEQARLLREGMEAEITNLWNSGITMTLSSITADQTNPSSGRILTFTLTGEDVEVGESVSYSIGDKNSTYDVVVPSSAIHTDADGCFVYTVAVKSSPLGNRYTVKKKSVNVIASDDVSSAVSGDLSTADFVITTSTVPLEAGSQVRIAE